MITSKPIQKEGLRPTDPTDLLIDHPSEKIENQNVTDSLKFIRAAIAANDPQVANYKTAPKLKIKFRSRFINKFLAEKIGLTGWLQGFQISYKPCSQQVLRLRFWRAREFQSVIGF